MSSERGGGNKSSSRQDEGKTGESSEGTPQQEQPSTTEANVPLEQTLNEQSGETATDPKKEDETESGEESLDRKPAARPTASQKGEQTATTTGGPSEVSPASAEESTERPRQVIAVSANRGPTAFFNLARRFLITDEMCDLSALEGAIVSAVDAAHLLERSKLATIVR